jgi:hypothetical protein
MTEHPYMPAIRTLTGLRLALEKLEPGVRFSEHVLIAALPRVINPRYDLVHILVGREAFSHEERARFSALCARLEFVCLHTGIPSSSESETLYQRIVSDTDLAAVAAGIPFSIWPPTDDRPFQYALDPSHVLEALRHGELIALLSGNPLISMALRIGALAAFLTLTPLLFSRHRAANLSALRSHWGMLLYFACIGFAYMAVEIAALLRLQSFLGKPIYGLSVGLFAFLLASGLGSNWTQRLADARLERSLRVIVALLVLAGGLFAVGSDFLFASTTVWPISARIGVAVVSIFPVAFPMGMLFPIGVRLIARDREDLIPWGWAINGCFSVLGIFSTRITALLFGFSRALLLGLAIYLLVVVCVRIHTRGDQRRRV